MIGTIYDMENSKKRIDYRYLMSNIKIDFSLRNGYRVIVEVRRICLDIEME